MTSEPSTRSLPTGRVPGLLYIRDSVGQVRKHRHNVCGDHHLCHRSFEETYFILCDGIGSGMRANIAATMCAHRLMHLLTHGIPLSRASEMVVSMMHRARTEVGIPFAAFNVAHILNNGQYTVVSYESPAPVLICRGAAESLSQNFFTRGHEVVAESGGHLRPGEALVLMTDGVTQAGLGRVKGTGWGEDRVVAEITATLRRGIPPDRLPEQILEQARLLSGGSHGDDTTLAVLSCRQAKVLNLLTGPPRLKAADREFVEDFMAQEGRKVVCGSTTADIVARVTGQPLKVLELSTSFASPPTYQIPGVDLVTEGAVTLNQLYNILEEDLEDYQGGSCVGEICRMMKSADMIRLFVGGARNLGNQGLEFKQLGVLPRNLIVSLLIEKLRSMGKVVIEEKG